MQIEDLTKIASLVIACGTIITMLFKIFKIVSVIEKRIQHLEDKLNFYEKEKADFQRTISNRIEKLETKVEKIINVCNKNKKKC